MSTTPHDALFKSGFEVPSSAAALFRRALPSALVDAIAWDSLVRESGSFVDSELAPRHSDLLFRATMHDRPVLLYLLLEHQSTSDPDMPLRMLVYLVRIWERFRKEHEHAPLPAIVPLVVAHAPEGWRAPRTFHSMFEPEPATIPGLAQLVPSFAIVVEDLSTVTNDEIRSFAMAAFPMLVLWALRDARTADRLLQSLPQWTPVFAEALRGPRGFEAVAQLLRYFFLVGDELFLAELRARLDQIPTVGALAMTIAEALRNEGRDEGREQGQRELLRALVVAKFGASTDELDARIDAAGPDELARWAALVLTARAPDELLG